MPAQKSKPAYSAILAAKHRPSDSALAGIICRQPPIGILLPQLSASSGHVTGYLIETTDTRRRRQAACEYREREYAASPLGAMDALA